MLNVELRTVHEHVLLDGMPVKVDEQVETLFEFGFEVLDQLEEVECFRECVLALLVECTVEVLAEQACAVIACDNTVGVYHWDYICDELFAELFGLWVLTADMLQEPFADE